MCCFFALVGTKTREYLRTVKKNFGDKKREPKGKERQKASDDGHRALNDPERWVLVEEIGNDEHSSAYRGEDGNGEYGEVEIREIAKAVDASEPLQVCQVPDRLSFLPLILFFSFHFFFFCKLTDFLLVRRGSAFTKKRQLCSVSSTRALCAWPVPLRLSASTTSCKSSVVEGPYLRRSLA